MPWTRVKAKRTKQFFDRLNTARVESVVQYFHTRYDHRNRDDKITGLYDLAELSAFPLMGLNRRGAIDRAIYDRAANLLPGIANYFEFKLPLDPARWVNSVASCANSTQEIARGPRTGNTKAQIIRALGTLKLRYQGINGIFYNFPELRYAFDEVSRGLVDGELPQSFDSLRRLPSIGVLAEIIFRHIDLDIALDGEAGRYLNFEPRSAKPKLNCVEKTAYICKRFGGPKIVSTPGSDYSSICGIIYEIATGRVDESMQGAIVSFFMGDRPELCWYETPDDGLSEDEMDVWAAEYEARRAKIAASVASQFRDDRSVYAHLLKGAVRQIRNSEEWIERATKRAKIRSLGQRAKKKRTQMNSDFRP
jgi:hypothetical protein